MFADTMDFLVAAGLLGLLLSSFLMGRQSHRLHLAEMTAAIAIAKQDIGWQFERYRLEVMRMEWIALPIETRKEYVRTWGRPTWTRQSTGQPDR
jgi:hypothetical protein